MQAKTKLCVSVLKLFQNELLLHLLHQSSSCKRSKDIEEEEEEGSDASCCLVKRLAVYIKGLVRPTVPKKAACCSEFQLLNMAFLHRKPAASSQQFSAISGISFPYGSDALLKSTGLSYMVDMLSKSHPFFRRICET
jgi:hypothetical protein